MAKGFTFLGGVLLIGLIAAACDGTAEPQPTATPSAAAAKPTPAPTPTPLLVLTPLPPSAEPGQPFSRSEQWGLYLVEADGSGLARLTEEFGYLLAWRDDRTAIVQEDERLFFIDIETGAQEELITLSPRTVSVALSPTLTHIATVENTNAPFTSIDQPAGTDILRLITLEGGGKKLIAMGRIGSVVWSPDGQKLAYLSGSPDGRDGVDSWTIFVADIATPARPIPIAAGVQPTWSPDGERILYSRCAPEEAHVYSTRADGTDTLQLTFKEVDACSGGGLSLHPDGDLVIVEYDNPPDLAVVPTDGSRKIDALVPGLWGDWSRDGRYIVLKRHGDDRLLLYEPDTGEEIAVGSLGYLGGYDWSPDGRRLAYTAKTPTQESRSTDLYVFDLDTRVTYHVLHTPGEDLWQWSPKWTPDGERIIVAVEGGPRS